MSSIVYDRVGFVLPSPDECPQMIAEAVWDVRHRKDTPITHKIIQDKYVLIDFLMDAIGAVYETNEWTFSIEERKMFRKIFRAKPSVGPKWIGNAKMERHAAANKQPTKWKEPTAR